MVDAAIGTTPATATIAQSIRDQRARRAKRQALLKHLFLIVTSLVMIYPLLWMLASSLKDNNEIFGQLSLWPDAFKWENYSEGWTALPVSFTSFFWNST